MQRALVFSPYWETLGGGEKYVAQAIGLLEALGFQVTIWWNDKLLTQKIKARYGISWKRVEVIEPDSLGVRGIGRMSRWWQTRDYELALWVSDGSIPLLLAKRVFIHFQVPFVKSKVSLPDRLLNTVKLQQCEAVVVNSLFTKDVIDRSYHVDSQVIYPPCSMISAGKKDPLMILSVGRFDNTMHAKRQDILLEAFDQLDSPGVRLVLAGGMLHSDQEVQALSAMIGERGLAVELVVNPDWNKLYELYQSASIYWHAAGYGVDLQREPERAEHFGISVVEAMSAGAVPIVFDGGGLREIVTNKVGFRFTSIEELIQHTRQLLANHDELKHLSFQARSHAERYSTEAFADAFKQLLY